MHGNAELLHTFGQERAGADDAHVGRAESGERMDQRACHARVQHVSDDGDREPVEVLLVVPDGVDVEQALGRMRVAPVAGVDHVHVRATWLAIKWAAPLEECRTTNMSAYIAERFATVSSSASPL